MAELPQRTSDRSAVVVGAGPNGLVAALALAREGWRVRVLEAGDRPGGGTRCEELTLPGFVHDVCSAVHPLGVASPAMRELGVADGRLGVEFVHASTPLAHPLDGARAAVLERSIDDTAAALAGDAGAYHRVLGPTVEAGADLVDGLLSPLQVPPAHPVLTARYARLGLRSARALADRFDEEPARALVAGNAAHSLLSLEAPITAGFALLLMALGHTVGWPIVRGGSERMAEGLVAELDRLGGEVLTDSPVRSLDDVGPCRALILDLTPRQVLGIAGDLLPDRYSRRLDRYRYGSGAFKVDWALDEPIPWASDAARRATTVHVGGTFEEIAQSEADVAAGRHPARPFAILAQPTIVDPTRAPEGKHTAWAYCHVPHGSDVDMTDAIEAQVERFAPGFKDRILARHVMGPAALQTHDANYVGGDINGGAADLWQFFARPSPSLDPWSTPMRGLYLCSAATPPGGGVHGMCGWNAAQSVLRRER